MTSTRIAILNDYQHAAMTFADWSSLDAEAKVFDEAFPDADALVEQLVRTRLNDMSQVPLSGNTTALAALLMGAPNPFMASSAWGLARSVHHPLDEARVGGSRERCSVATRTTVRGRRRWRGS
jgi:hypothetical protein